MTRAIRIAGLATVAALMLALQGCVTPPKPYDYSAFQQSLPRSILVLPPLNESVAVEGTYSYLSTVSRPIAEHGYYVFPVAVIDQLMRENGLPDAAEMQKIPLPKLREITGADAVLYTTLHQYGSQYIVLSSTTTVDVSARLVDTRTGALLWESREVLRQGTSGGGQGLLGQLVGALITQVINSKTDPAHGVSRMANFQMVGMRGRGLPFGPYHPDAGKLP